MAGKPSEETLRKIRTFCQQLADRQDLDDRSRDEICGHLEDKLAGYLSGEVRPNEEDALVLARAQFGDADRVARLINELSANAGRTFASRKRMVKRLSAALAVQTLVAVPISYLAMVAVTVPGGTALLKGSLTLVLVAWAALFALESGVFLAFRADLRRNWQRLTAALFLVAPVVAQWILLIHGSLFLFDSSRSPDEASASVVLSLLVMLLGVSGFAGHIWLLVLMLLRRPDDPVPVASIAHAV